MRQYLASQLQHGLSLIELLVTMTIAVILLAVGVPSFIEFTTSNTASSYANDLLGDLNYARSEAITRGVRVTVCQSSNGSSCGDTEGIWTMGWIVFANTDPDGNEEDFDGDDEMLLKRAAINYAAGWTLKANSLIEKYISFRPSGVSNRSGTFVFCKDGVVKSGSQTRSSAVTVINATGRARILRDTDGNGAPNDSGGNLTNDRCAPVVLP